MLLSSHNIQESAAALRFPMSTLLVFMTIKTSELYFQLVVKVYQRMLLRCDLSIITIMKNINHVLFSQSDLIFINNQTKS